MHSFLKKTPTLTYIILSTLPYICICIGCGNNTFTNGQSLYNNKCANCHQVDGKGFESLYPPLRDSDYWKKHQKDIPCIIRHGISDTLLVNGKEFHIPMLPISDLSESEIANIINYINKEWYNNTEFYTPSKIKKSLEDCK